MHSSKRKAKVRGSSQTATGEELELRQLRCFVQICKDGSFSRAAAALAISQPILSRQIKNLENNLGVTLFYRHGRGAMPTAEGQRLLTSANDMLAMIARLREEVTEERGIPRGRVILALPPFLSAVLAVPLTRHVAEHYPSINLHIIDGFSGHLHEWLLEGRVDIAILNEASRSRVISVEPLMSINLMLAGKPGKAWDKLVGRGDVVPTRRLSDVPLILAERSHGIRLAIETALGKAGAQLNLAYAVDSLAAQKALIAEGMGFGIMPFTTLRLEVEAGKLDTRAIVKPRIQQECVLVTSAERPVTLAMRTIINFMRSHAEALYEADLPPKWKKEQLV
jgi:LysR family nitrogen assimilation transcriptional regulator